MSKPDKNLISFTGDKEGNIWRNGDIMFTKDTPIEKRTWTEKNIQIPPNEKIADTLKFSGVRDFVLIVDGDVPGGYEDCIDINNECYNLEIFVINGGVLIPHGKYAITLKGGSKNIKIEAIISHHAKAVDIDLGNHSDQSKQKSENIVLNVLMANDTKTTYRVINASSPTLLPDENYYKRKFRIRGFFKPIFVWIYSTLKKLGVPI